MAAFDTRTGKVYGECRATRKGDDLVEFMEEVAARFPGKADPAPTAAARPGCAPSLAPTAPHAAPSGPHTEGTATPLPRRHATVAKPTSGKAEPTPRADLGAPTLLPVEKEGQRVSLFSTSTTLGSPLDAQLRELRIETFFPADAASEAFLKQLAKHV